MLPQILKLVTSMYLPYLVANSRASRGDEVRVEFRLDDGETFLHREKFGSYQKKCFEVSYSGFQEETLLSYAELETAIQRVERITAPRNKQASRLST